MGLTLNLTGVKGDMNDVKSGGFKKIPPGRGLVRINKFGEFSHQKTGAHELELEIINWTDESAIGDTHTELIFAPKAGQEDYTTAKLLRLALAAGILTPKQAEDVRDGAGECEIDLVGTLPTRAMYVEISERADKNDPNKKYVGIGDFGNAYFHVGDPRVQGWPTNQGVINQCAGLVGQWQPTSTGAPETKPENPFAAKV